MIRSFKLHSCVRPYHGKITGSRLISKVKHRRAWVVLGCSERKLQVKFILKLHKVSREIYSKIS